MSSNERLFKIDLEHNQQRVKSLVNKAADLSQKSDIAALEWAGKAINNAEYGVEAAVQAMELESFSILAITGEQGGGKDSMLKALKIAASSLKDLDCDGVNPSLRSLISAFSGNMGEITTGTGGMFNKPEGEYAATFARMQEITSPYPPARGVLVPDTITTTYTYLMIQTRIFEGYSTIVTNVWPRTEDQGKHAEQLLSRLSTDVETISGEPFKTRLDMIDLKIMDPETLSRVEANREGYALKAEKLGAEFKAWAQENGKAVAALEPRAQLLLVKDMLRSKKDEYVEDQITIDLLDEAELSFRRVATRLAESQAVGEGRKDDKDIVAVLTRIGSYLSSTAPNALRNKNVKLVAANQLPDRVVLSIIEAMLGAENMNDKNVLEFVKVAQESANMVVFKKTTPPTN